MVRDELCVFMERNHSIGGPHDLYEFKKAQIHFQDTNIVQFVPFFEQTPFSSWNLTRTPLEIWEKTTFNRNLYPSG